MAHLTQSAIEKIQALLSQDEKEVGVLALWRDIEEVLLNCGSACKREIHSDEIMVHPDNRGGLGLNWFNAHRNLRLIKSVGVDLTKLSDATCFEMSMNKATRHRQIEFNRRLSESSNGYLAPLSGQERYMSVATGHMAAGIRAVNKRCKTTNTKLRDKHGNYSYELVVTNSPKLEKLLTKGWTFTVIEPGVEDESPSIPKIAQRALNASNNIACDTSELEVAATIAEYYDMQVTAGCEVDWDSCVENVKASQPPCAEYIETIGSYTQNYGGGPGAPIIKFLEFFSKEFGGDRKLGQDFFSALEALEFAKGQGMRPLTRSACIATNMTGPKVQDGFCRFLLPSHIEKLNSKAFIENVDKVESALQLSWTTMQTCISQGTDEYDAFKHFGRLSCRSIM